MRRYLRPRPRHVRRPGPADRGSRAERAGAHHRPGRGAQRRRSVPRRAGPDDGRARSPRSASDTQPGGRPDAARADALESLSEAKIAELKVILKAEARGSIEAIRKELEKLHHEEVRVRILHAAIGGITESDVQLALTSPEDTLILGFNVVPDDEAQALAEERGIQIRQYNIIYNLTDDIRSALEGKLKPREDIIHLGRAVVRETFKISRVGTIAGCYVTQGTIERSAKVRVIRSGVVVYPPADRTVGPGVAQALQGGRARGPRGLRVRPQGRRLRRHQGGRRDRGVPHRAGAAHACHQFGVWRSELRSRRTNAELPNVELRTDGCRLPPCPAAGP